MTIIKAAGILLATVAITLYTLSVTRYVNNPMYYKSYVPSVKFGQTKTKTNAKYDGIIRLKTMDEDYFCSGFVIDGSYAITAAHCVYWMKDGKTIKIFDKKNTNTGVVAKLLGFNHRNDSAVITGDFTNFHPLPIEKDRHGFFEYPGPYKVCGYPYGQKKIYCSDARVVEPWDFGVHLLGAGIPGMSGGPTLDARTGKVLGLNSAVEGLYLFVYPLTGVLGSFDLDN